MFFIFYTIEYKPMNPPPEIPSTYRLTDSKPPAKCVCVPSGRCHSYSLCGCPHKHYFNDKNVWTCKKV
jgi:hypothetical protein